MKKMFLLLALFIPCLFSAVYGQDKAKKTPEDKARRKTSEMVVSLKLSKEQETMLYAVNLKSYQSISAYEAKKPSKKMRKKQKDIVQGMREAEFKKILTPVQFSQYQKLEAEENRREQAEKEQKKKQEELEKKKTGGKKKEKEKDETLED